LLVNQLVNVVIARVGTLTMVADYNILLKIYMLIFTVGISFSAPFYPAIREAYEKKERSWVLRSIKRVVSIRLGVLILPGLILLAVGDRLIQLWIHQPLSSNFGLLGWATFLVCMLLAATSSTLGEILTSLDDIWSQIKIVFISAIIVVTCMYVLIPKIGLMAIYIAMMLSAIYPIYWSYKKLREKFIGEFT
jgi:O-antigen/teichoic acid export membrane protein